AVRFWTAVKLITLSSVPLPAPVICQVFEPAGEVRDQLLQPTPSACAPALLVDAHAGTLEPPDRLGREGAIPKSSARSSRQVPMVSLSGPERRSKKAQVVK